MARYDFLTRYFTKIAIALIKFYQLIFARLIYPNCCKFYPSCSQYSIEAINKYGLIKGLFFAIKRIISCNPWNKKYGYDPVKNLAKTSSKNCKIK
jgi:putative membrane protein insertion efficiency factor